MAPQMRDSFRYFRITDSKEEHAGEKKRGFFRSQVPLSHDGVPACSQAARSRDPDRGWLVPMPGVRDSGEPGMTVMFWGWMKLPSGGLEEGQV